MRKTIVLAIIACILGIVLLASLAFYIPNGPGRRDNVEESELFTGFQFQTENIRKENILSAENLPSDTLVSEEARQVKQTEETQAPVRKTDVQNVTSDMARLSDGAAAIPEHQIIWAGDSRTLGMRDALHKAGRTDEDIFVGKVGEGVHWFQEEGMAELSDAIAENPDLPVVLNFGVNDPQLIDEYVAEKYISTPSNSMGIVFTCLTLLYAFFSILGVIIVQHMFGTEPWRTGVACRHLAIFQHIVGKGVLDRSMPFNGSQRVAGIDASAFVNGEVQEQVGIAADTMVIDVEKLFQRLGSFIVMEKPAWTDGDIHFGGKPHFAICDACG